MAKSYLLVIIPIVHSFEMGVIPMPLPVPLLEHKTGCLSSLTVESEANLFVLAVAMQAPVHQSEK